MKFESKLAQAAYDEIADLLQALAERAESGGIRPESDESKIRYANLTLDIMARAIEVAAKIEIEEKRLEFEKMRGWIPQGCQHEWFNRVEGWFCTKCGIKRE